MARQEKRPGESIDSVLRKFKRKLKNEGTLQELRLREFFEKPSDLKKRKKKAAERRTKQQQSASDVF
ncbi:MAG: 30S ribosomal protein S21 [Candidatus Margulisbacteria bacterium]|jgi:small subunit ribosomal protein S21|nr:30S ribosomal protein S21 [Candidatus Margulisiibacteriota bacterium]